MKAATQIVATRAFTAGGITFAAGEVLDKPQLAAIGDINPLLGRGWLAATPDPSSRKSATGTPRPTNISGSVRSQFIASMSGNTPISIGVVMTGKIAALTITGGNGPFAVQWGDGDTQTVSGTSASHTYVDYESWIVSVTDQNGTTDTASIAAVAEAPGAPTALVATVGVLSASIAFTAAPANGSAITDYEYTLNDGVAWTSAGITASPLVLDPIPAVETTVKIRAVNAVGTGPASAAVTFTPDAE